MTNSTEIDNNISEPEWPFKFEYLPIDSLFEDQIYQRQKKQKRVMEMATGYQPALVGALIVNRREDGLCAVMDGGTRLQATQLRNKLTDNSAIENLPCIVFDGLSVASEAEYYEYYNTWTVPVSGVDKFRARVARGEEGAVTVNRLITNAGLQIDDPSQPNFIKATNQLERIYADFGVEAAKTALEAASYWPRNQDALQGPFLFGVARLYASEQDRARVLPALQDLARVNTAHYVTELLRKSVRNMTSSAASN
jgi:hypothetical protein